jgi:hypothetical protein
VDERAGLSVPPHYRATFSYKYRFRNRYGSMCRIQPFPVSIAFSCKAVLKATRAGVRLA